MLEFGKHRVTTGEKLRERCPEGVEHVHFRLGSLQGEFAAT
jgi:hypothetical protein